MTTTTDAANWGDAGSPDEETVEGGGATGYTIFDGSEIAPLTELMTLPEVPDYVTDMADLMTVWGGLKSKVVFATEDGLNIVHVTLGADFILLPHSHSVNCAYYVTAGEIRLGRRRLGPGAGFYIPVNHRYAYTAGPEGAELLEIRDGRGFDMKMASLSASRYAAVVANAKAHDGWPDL